MGFLEFGVPLHWADSLPYCAYVRQHGVEQFINLYHRVKGRVNDVLKWGDEIEYHLVELPPASGAAEEHAPRVALIASELLEKLEREDATQALCVRPLSRASPFRFSKLSTRLPPPPPPPPIERQQTSTAAYCLIDIFTVNDFPRRNYSIQSKNNNTTK